MEKDVINLQDHERQEVYKRILKRGETEGIADAEYWRQRCIAAENLCRVIIRVNPMVKNLSPVKEARDKWTPYPNLHDQLKVWNDHE